jgi:hypothetical protein
LLQELENYWRAQRQGKADHDSPWLFLGKKAGQPMGRYTGQNIYYTALEWKKIVEPVECRKGENRCLRGGPMSSMTKKSFNAPEEIRHFDKV